MKVLYTHSPQAATQRGAEIPIVSNAVAEAQATEHPALVRANPWSCIQDFTLSNAAWTNKNINDKLYIH